jgi:hypothetical protein
VVYACTRLQVCGSLVRHYMASFEFQSCRLATRDGSEGGSPLHCAMASCLPSSLLAEQRTKNQAGICIWGSGLVIAKGLFSET